MIKTTGLSALIAVVLTGCNSGADPAAGRMEMRAYEVPAETTQDVQRALQNSFSTGDKTYVGNVGVVAPGKLLVMAPASLQDSIAASIKQVVKAPNPSDTSQQLRVQFWSVDAVPGKAHDATPPELNDALAQARPSLGDVHFVLRDQAGGVTSPGREVDQSWINSNPGSAPNDLRYTVSGSADSLAMTFRYNDQTPLAETKASYSHAGISVSLPLKLGQTVVLSQTPVTGAEPVQRGMRLYLVRADAVK